MTVRPIAAKGHERQESGNAIRRHPDIRPSTVIYASYGADITAAAPRAIANAAWEQGLAETRGAFDTLWATRLGWSDEPVDLAALWPAMYRGR